MTRRRILLLITDLQIGGTPTVVRELAIRLQPFAHVEVACLKKWGPVANPLRDAGMTVTALDAARVWHLPRTVRRVRELVREHRIETLLSFLLHANAVAAAALRLCPSVLGIQSIQTVQAKPAWHWRLQGMVQGCAGKIVMPSHAIVRVAGERSGVPAEKCVVIPNAVDPASYEQTRVFAGPVKRIGYIGRLDPAKRPGLLLGMMRRVDETVELHYFGDGPARASLEAAARATATRGRVVFHGTVAGPSDALRQIDCLMLPSAVEGFGLVLIEAMAAGVPVIACGAGGVLEVVTHMENGVLVRREDYGNPIGGASEADGYYEAFLEVRDDVSLRTRLITNGLQTVRERFSWDVVLPQYRKLLEV